METKSHEWMLVLHHESHKIIDIIILTWTIVFASCSVVLNPINYVLHHHYDDSRGASVSWHFHYLNLKIQHVILSFLMPPCLILSWTVMVSVYVMVFLICYIFNQRWWWWILLLKKILMFFFFECKKAVRFATATISIH